MNRLGDKVTTCVVVEEATVEGTNEEKPFSGGIDAGGIDESGTPCRAGATNWPRELATSGTNP